MPESALPSFLWVWNSARVCFHLLSIGTGGVFGGVIAVWEDVEQAVELEEVEEPFDDPRRAGQDDGCVGIAAENGPRIYPQRVPMFHRPSPTPLVPRPRQLRGGCPFCAGNDMHRRKSGVQAPFTTS